MAPLQSDNSTHSTDKILEFDELCSIAHELKAVGRKIVLCHGVFDLLHIGHIRYFKQAQSFGDVLIVTVTPDQHVDKGPHRPAFPESLRAEAIASLGFVDYVAINKWPTAVETLKLLRPDFYVKGSEFKSASSDRTGKIGEEIETIHEIGAQFAYTDDIVFSSSNLINRYLTTFPDEVNNYLTLLRKRYKLATIIDFIDRMANLKVLVIGDTILDEYQYCQAIGKSSKDPTLVVKYQSKELYAGGVLAVANHVANFAGQVDLFTVLGETDRHEQFIISQLKNNITPHFYTQKSAPTTIKRRIVDGYSFSKLFEIYVMNDSGLDDTTDHKLRQNISEKISEYDLVISADFGHGTISYQSRDLLIKKSPFLAINTQSNAGNRGYHTISRYHDFDFACLAGHELALELREHAINNYRDSMKETLSKLNGRHLIVTLGRNGCASYKTSPQGVYLQVPSFAEKVVDRVGAGDAFFAVTSLAAALNADQELLAFLGNVVGSLAVEIIGNKKAITKEAVEKYVTALMK